MTDKPDTSTAAVEKQTAEWEKDYITDNYNMPPSEIDDALKLLRSLAAERDEKEKQIEQLRVQLAGCGVATLGGTSEELIVKRGDYGWSPSYEDTLNLRRKYDAALKRAEEAEKENEAMKHGRFLGHDLAFWQQLLDQAKEDGVLEMWNRYAVILARIKELEDRNAVLAADKEKLQNALTVAVEGIVDQVRAALRRGVENAMAHVRDRSEAEGT